jgi:thiamine biosynthesis lipoprotein
MINELDYQFVLYEVKDLSKKILACLLMITFIFNLTACDTTKKTRYEASFLELFDTVTKIVGYAKDKDEFTGYAQIIYDNLKVYHQLYDIYNDYDGINNVKTINENAGIKPVKVDPMTGYRYYSVNQVQQINSLLELKALGFSLKEICSI